MPERRTTGGAKEFAYQKEDLERIRETDTAATKAFKDAYRAWGSQREKDRTLEEQLRRQRFRLTIIAGALMLALLLMIAMLLSLR